MDADAGGSKVFYNRLFGNSVVEKSFSLDKRTGEIRVVDNTLLDRESSEGKHIS